MKISILGFLFFISSGLYAQNGVIETVYLKNGSIIKGMIVEIVPNISYTVKTSDGSVFVCAIGEVLKITRELETAKAAENKSVQSKIWSKGYEGVVETGYSVKTGKYGLDIVKLNIINGYRINKSYFAGFGTGLRIIPETESTLIPFFLDFRTAFIPKPISPYASFSAGMSFNTAYGFKDAGWMFHPEIGVQVNKNKDILFHITIGYDVQQVKFPRVDNSNPWNPIQSNVIRFSESGSINLGITF